MIKINRKKIDLRKLYRRKNNDQLISNTKGVVFNKQGGISRGYIRRRPA
jgi:hypothetical protein